MGYDGVQQARDVHDYQKFFLKLAEAVGNIASLGFERSGIFFDLAFIKLQNIPDPVNNQAV